MLDGCGLDGLDEPSERDPVDDPTGPDHADPDHADRDRADTARAAPDTRRLEHLDRLDHDGAAWRARAAVDDFERPSSARVYDYLLGGAVNGAVDRDLGRELARLEPTVVSMAHENRSFLRRAVSFLARGGIDQFLDLGSGIPNKGNVHEIAQRANPAARVAYVDVDPVAVGHGETLLAGLDDTSITQADLRDVDGVLEHPRVRATLDLSRPVALCLFSVLQHIPDDDDPAELVRRYTRALAPGSAVALSHVTSDDARIDVAAVRRLTSAYARGAMTPRTRATVASLLAGVELVTPGLVWAGVWRPEVPGPHLAAACGHQAGVGFLPR